MTTLKKIKNLLAPFPVILVTTRIRRKTNIHDNIAPFSWVNTIDYKPDLISINIFKARHTANTIKETGQFGISIPQTKHIKDVDICGITHGDKVNKFELIKLTKFEANQIDVPLIKECPINMECKLKKVVSFNTHDMFVGEIVKTHLDDGYSTNNGEPDFRKMDILCLVNNYYWTLGKQLEKIFYTKTKK